MKVPFIQTVFTFDKRWLEWSGDPNQMPTKDKKYIWVDSYTRWRIEDPLLFYQRVTEARSAQSRLDDIVDGETRNVIANNDLIEVVRSTAGPSRGRGERGRDGCRRCGGPNSNGPRQDHSRHPREVPAVS